MTVWTAISAVAACVAAVGTIGTLGANSYQIKRLQVRQNQEDERRDADAVSCWMDQRGARVLNQATAPVYNVVVCQVYVQGAAPRTAEEVPEDHKFPLQLVPPTSDGVLILNLPGPQGMNTIPAVEVAFQDSRSRSWIRRADGRLSRLAGDPDPFTYLQIELPVSYATTSRVQTGLVASGLIEALYETVGSLRSLAAKGQKLRSTSTQSQSRSHLSMEFENCVLALARVRLLLPAIGVGSEGYWLLEAANYLAASLLQADEYDGEHENSSVFVNGRYMESSSMYTVECLISDLPMDDGIKLERLDRWWRRLVEKYGDGRSVYSPDSPYMVQHSRLVDDYVREYFTPWSQRLISERLR